MLPLWIDLGLPKVIRTSGTQHLAENWLETALGVAEDFDENVVLQHVESEESEAVTLYLKARQDLKLRLAARLHDPGV